MLTQTMQNTRGRKSFHVLRVTRLELVTDIRTLMGNCDSKRTSTEPRASEVRFWRLPLQYIR